MYDILQLNEMILPELKEIAEQLQIKKYKSLDKQSLIHKILDAQALNPDTAREVAKSSKAEKEVSEEPEKKARRPRKRPQKSEKEAPAKEE